MKHAATCVISVPVILDVSVRDVELLPSAGAGDFDANRSNLSQPERLADRSPRDKPWDTHRGQASDVQDIYASASEFEAYANRLDRCSGLLRFGRVVNTDTGEIGLTLREAQFCRVRHCPVCQWRRSLMWQARFYQALPKIIDDHPRARWIFLTLTIRNCEIGSLAATLKAMNSAWQRLKDRKEFAHVAGWIRTTEVTRGADGSAHPHFHALLMVKPSYFKGEGYVSQARWADAWARSLRVDYTPVVDVRTVKPKGDVTDVASYLRGAVSETLKYSVKPDDMTSDPDWFLELTRQCHKKRFIATGGALKDVLRVDEESDDDLIVEGDGDADDGSRVAFGWRESSRYYAHTAKHDRG
jgi:plasmid rolling circle replication initiator protein Rep